MEKFIIPDLPGVNSRIDSDLNKIVIYLLDKLGNNVVGIILCGGFGRGEGSVIKLGESYKPFNDYDLFLITKKRVPKAFLSEMEKILAKKVGMRFVDLGATTLKRLRRLKGTVFAMDLRASKILYGTKSLLENLPETNKFTLPEKEALYNLQNRLICFLELTPDNFFEKTKVDLFQHRQQILQISKAVIGASVATLIKKREYVTSYKTQMDILSTMPYESKTKALINTAYMLKLGLADPDKINPQQYWFTSRQYFIDIFTQFFVKDSTWEKFFSTHINTKISMKTKLKYLVKSILFGEKTVNQKSRQLAEIYSLILILHPQEGSTLGKVDWGSFNAPTDNWAEAKRFCVDFWFKHHH